MRLRKLLEVPETHKIWKALLHGSKSSNTAEETRPPACQAVCSSSRGLQEEAFTISPRLGLAIQTPASSESSIFLIPSPHPPPWKYSLTHWFTMVDFGGLLLHRLPTWCE